METKITRGAARPAQARVPRSRADALPFDVVPAKLRVPEPRPGSISRTALVNRLRGARGCRITVLAAPPGYGKTTALAQWTARDSRSFAWITADERDNDPVVLLRHVAAALHRSEPLSPPVLEALAAPGESHWTAAVPRLATELAARRSPVVIVLDNATLVHAPAAADVLGSLADHLPSESTLVLSGRAQPSLPLSARRAEGSLLEIGRELLALTPREAGLLVRATGLALTDDELAALLSRTEGWAAGVYLGALALSEGAEFGGDDRYLAEYFDSSCLGAATPARAAFLRRTSVLERMCGDLCDAVLGGSGSALELELIEREGHFVVPLDRRGGWYRYHPLFRDLLRRELARHEPGADVAIAGSAADWFEGRGEIEAAIECAAAAGALGRVACLLGPVALGAANTGRIEAVEPLLDHFSDETARRDNRGIVPAGTWVHALRGRAVEAEQWLADADAGAGPASLVRAAVCRDGAAQMLADAETAPAELPPESPWTPAALFLQGTAHLLLDAADAADAAFAAAADLALRLGAPELRAAALAERALIAIAGDDHQEAERFVHEAREIVRGPDGTALAVLERAAAARTLLRRSRFDEARAELAAARELEPLLSHALPWLAVQARLHLARAQVALRNGAAAAEHILEAELVLRQRPDLGALRAEVEVLRADVSAASGRAPSGLTGAELRLLPLLATHLSFREIGDRLYLSRHTVKTQAISTYRKLGVSSRSDAIRTARELGLLELDAERLAAVAS